MVKIECCQSGHRTVKLTVSQKWTDVLNFFLHAGTNSEKQIDSMIFWVGVVKKWLWPLNSRDPEICFILKINLWIEPILECFRLISYSLTFKIWGSTVVVLLAISQINCILYLFFSCKVFEAFAVLVLNFIFVNLLNSWVTINLVVSIYQHLQSFL